MSHLQFIFVAEFRVELRVPVGKALPIGQLIAWELTMANCLQIGITAVRAEGLIAALPIENIGGAWAIVPR